MLLIYIADTSKPLPASYAAKIIISHPGPLDAAAQFLIQQNVMTPGVQYQPYELKDRTCAPQLIAVEKTEAPQLSRQQVAAGLQSAPQPAADAVTTRDHSGFEKLGADAAGDFGEESMFL